MNGGPHFVYDQAEDLLSEDTLGWYKMKDGARHPAIIHSKFGKGNAVLSGVHFEFESNNFIKGKSRDRAKRNNQARLDLIDTILSDKLGLSVRSKDV